MEASPPSGPSSGPPGDVPLCDFADLYSDMRILRQTKGKVTRFRYVQLFGPSLRYALKHRPHAVQGYLVDIKTPLNDILALMAANKKAQADYMEFFLSCDARLNKPILRRGARGALPDEYKVVDNADGSRSVSATWWPQPPCGSMDVTRVQFAPYFPHHRRAPVPVRVDVASILPGELPSLSITDGPNGLRLNFYTLEGGRFYEGIKLERSQHYTLVPDERTSYPCLELYLQDERDILVGSAEYHEASNGPVQKNGRLYPNNLMEHMMRFFTARDWQARLWRDFEQTLELQPHQSVRARRPVSTANVVALRPDANVVKLG